MGSCSTNLQILDCEKFVPVYIISLSRGNISELRHPGHRCYCCHSNLVLWKVFLLFCFCGGPIVETLDSHSAMCDIIFKYITRLNQVTTALYKTAFFFFSFKYCTTPALLCLDVFSVRILEVYQVWPDECAMLAPSCCSLTYIVLQMCCRRQQATILNYLLVFVLSI